MSPERRAAAWERLRLEDAAARRLAQQEFARPLVLEAGAGTGKTTALVARIAVWCLGPGWGRAGLQTRSPAPSDEVAARVLDRVVAITFTEAAAAEMGERVGGALAALEQGGCPTWLARDLLPAEDGELVRRARHLLAALDRLQVSTIHAFCRRLLAAHPLEAGLHPAFEVDAEGDALEEVLREVVADWLPRAYGQPGDPDALALARAGIGPGELAEAARALLTTGMPPGLLGVDPFDGREAAELAGRVSEAAERLARSGGARLKSALAAAPARRGQGSLAALEAAEGLARVAREAAGLGRRGSAALRASVLGLEAAVANKLRKWARADFTQTEMEAAGEAQSDLVGAATDLVRLLQHLEGLDPDLFDQARRALAPLVAETAAGLRRRGAVSFQGLLTGARDLLAGHPEVGRLERRRIDQLLVDEFQDTDRVQCDLLRWLALEGPEEERPGLFLVGDPKQSIYGWRSADLAAYDAFLAEVLVHGGERRHLSVNFRSVPAILDEVERLISPVMRHEVGVQPTFEPLAPSREREAAAGFAAGGRAPVEHWISWRGPQEEAGGASTPSRAASELEARAVAADLRRLHDEHGLAWGEAAILVRSGTDLDLYLRALQEAGIPYAVASDRSYYRRREVIDAAALVRSVLDPADHLALVTAMRAPWVGVPDAALARLWLADFPRLATELAAPDPEPLARVEALARQVAAEIAPLAGEIPGLAALAGWEASLSAFVAALGRLRASFAPEPAAVFLERLRTETLIEATEAARFLGPWRLANLDRFFRQLAEALDSGRGGEDILRFLRRAVAEAREAPEGRPQEAAADAVSVLTVHKAKGLDFGHLYLVQLHKEPQGRPEGRETVAEEVGGGWQLCLLGAPGPGFFQVEERRQRVRAAEQVRLLYVAATRARERLVLAGRAAPAPVAAERARSFADLVSRRSPPPPDPEEAMERLGAAGSDRQADGEGALWRYLGLGPEPEVPAARGQEVPLPSAESAAGEARELERRVAAARERQERPFRAAASEEAHRRLAALYGGDDEDGGRRWVGETAAGGRDVATAVGDAVHRLFEDFDLAADPAAELAQRRQEALRALGLGLEGEQLEAGRRRLGDLLDRLARGPLWTAFLALRPQVVARELPVLLPPAGEAAPVGYVAGAIDLLVREPDGGEFTLIDFKTDEADSEADLEARARTYAPQAEIYRRAVAEALGLEAHPRAELWFLAAGRAWPVP
jgi:ATP-dependent helicase/nuclease subunit A